jgi:hypothetical protein
MRSRHHRQGTTLLVALLTAISSVTAFTPGSPALTHRSRAAFEGLHRSRFQATVAEEKETTTESSLLESENSNSTSIRSTSTNSTANDTVGEADDVIFPELFLLLDEVQMEAEMAASQLIDENCEIDPKTGGAIDELCEDEEAREGFRSRLKAIIGETLQLVGNRGASEEFDETNISDLSEGEFVQSGSKKRTNPLGNIVNTMKSYVGIFPEVEELSGMSEGEILERGWEQRGKSSALVRNAEVWKFALASVFRVLKPRKLRKSGNATEAEITDAQIEAANYIRDGLLKLGPSFVKLGQVASTRTDVLPTTYTDVLKTLTDEVPGFSGQKAKQIVAKELGQPVHKIFTDFSKEPLKAASLGQVHTAFYKGKKVAVKVQRAGLKELFDIDLKNLKKLAVLLDKFDPKSDGADRDWVAIYEESERLLYLEIDYINEGDNAERFARDFKDIKWVRVPRIYREVSTPRVLVMEYIESLKLTGKFVWYSPEAFHIVQADSLVSHVLQFPNDCVGL